MRKLAVTFSAVGILAASFFAWADSQGNRDASKLSTQKVSENIAMLSGKGGNIAALFGEHGVLLVDDMFDTKAADVELSVKEFTSLPVSFLINTHFHAGQSAASDFLGTDDVVVVSHDNVRKGLISPEVAKTLDKKVASLAREGLPLVTYNKDVTFHLNNEQVHVKHVPSAHTNGDSIVFFEHANVIHTGDLHFEGMYPYIDVANGGSIEGVIAGLKEVLKLADDKTVIIPGSGPQTNKAKLTAQVDMLKTVLLRVEALVDEGKSLDQIVAVNVTKEFDTIRKDGIIKPEDFVRFVHASLTKDSSSLTVAIGYSH